MPARRCALLTCRDLRGFVVDDELLLPHFRAGGWEPESVIWDEPNVDWRRYDAAIVRTTWDYTEHLERFLVVLRSIEQAGVRLFNPFEVLKWNSRKTYLLELEAPRV